MVRCRPNRSRDVGALRQHAAVTVTAESVARFAGLLADRTRVAMCLALLDGRAWTAGELAAAAGVARSTATEHLNLLVAAGLLAEERQGRHRYLRLAHPAAAQLLEELGAVAGEPLRPTSLRSVRVAHELATARTCYDHLAGALGVALLDALVARGCLERAQGLALTDAGRLLLGDLLGGLPATGARPLLRVCLDWTERRHHLGGALGAALCRELLAREWLVRATRHRAVRLTPDGAAGLCEVLGRSPAWEPA
jgi:DNA-binding transcriptional ArsR family regulator